jgi:hypothetical protein
MGNAAQIPAQQTPANAANGIFEFWNAAWRQLNAMSEQYTRAAQGGLKAEQTQTTAQASGAAAKNQAAPKPRQP